MSISNLITVDFKNEDWRSRGSSSLWYSLSVSSCFADRKSHLFNGFDAAALGLRRPLASRAELPVDDATVIDACLMPLHLLFDHLRRDLLDVIRVTSDLAFTIWQIPLLFLHLIWEEGVELVIRNYLLIILRGIQRLRPVPSLYTGFADQVLGSGSVPSLDESVSLLDLDEVAIVPREVLVDAVIILDVVDVDLLIFKYTLEYQLVVNGRVTTQVQINIRTVSEVEARVPARRDLLWLVEACIPHLHGLAIPSFDYHFLAIRKKEHVLYLRPLAQEIDVVFSPKNHVRVEGRNHEERIAEDA